MVFNYRSNFKELATRALDKLALKSKFALKPTHDDWLPDITISREPGSGGKLVAKKVAKKLGFKFYDKRLNRQVCKKLGISIKTLKEIDEKPRSWISDVVHATFNPEYISDIEYVNVLRKVILEIGIKGDVVILGRGANHIIPDNKALHVRITAPLEHRTKMAMKYENLSEIQARNRVRQVSRKRSQFVRQYFGKSITDSANYDLVINTNNVSLDQAVNIIITAFKQKYPNHKLAK